MNIYKQIKNNIKEIKMRSAWDKGVKEYALELLEDLESNPSLIEEFNEGMPIRERDILNGACDWHAYSEGGCSFIYDEDIAERLCTPSELKRNRGGELPESPCYWINTQTRALKQASRLILRKFRVLQAQINKTTV
jgi:hypothetical protein